MIFVLVVLLDNLKIVVCRENEIHLVLMAEENQISIINKDPRGLFDKSP